jgi:hypothetical protein
LDRLSAGIPQNGQVTVVGADSCVEPRARVVVENLSASSGGEPVSAETNASVAGAFVVQIPATIGDQLSVFAVDAADNEGPPVQIAAGPNLATFHLTSVSGTGQTGVVNRPLTDPLRVRVTGGVPSVALPGVAVHFEVLSGGGSVGPTTATTDESGIAATSLTLGGAPGGAEARATLEGVAGEVRFTATGVGTPEIVSVSPTEGDRGASVEIVGRNFSPIAAHDVVEFNGVLADVQTATVERLTTRVPTFASDGQVTVTLTGARSNGVAFHVKGPPPALPDVGSVARSLLAFSSGTLALDLRLGFLTGAERYVVAVEILDTDATTQFRHGIAADATALTAGGAPRAARKGARPVGQLAAAAGQAHAERALRGWEVQLAEAMAGKPRPPAGRLAGGEPQIGDTETFHVLNTVDPNALITDPRNFDSVEATLRYKGAHTLVYVDNRVPALNLTDADIRDVGDRFDTQSYVVDTDAFGSESDIDGDGRVTILLTPTINALNEGASPDEGIIIGFFFSLDLLPAVSPPTSNAREMFYGFVPDPGGAFGPPIPRDFAILTLDEVFAHEFQHMISFNQHFLIRGSSPEALWLNEGMSHIAEDLNGFDGGNVARSALYLADPAATGLAIGGDALEERGAAFLFLRWLGDQRGEQIYGALEQTALTGIGNVEAASHQGFPNLFSDWFAALYLDDSGIGASEFQIPSLPLRTDYDLFRTANPELGLGPYLSLLPLVVPNGTTTENLTRGTAGQFYEVSTSPGINERKLRITAPVSSEAQVTVIRTR